MFKDKLLSQEPSQHPALRNAHAIKWFRDRVSDKIVSKSLNSMLKNPTMRDRDNSYVNLSKNAGSPKTVLTGKEKILNPSLFFADTTINKIKKLKQIFMEFDTDNSRKLELKEIYEMFNKNKIPVTLRELQSLFFNKEYKNIYIKNDNNNEENEYYLEFYNLVLFAINNQTNEKFIKFMRNLKAKLNNFDTLLTHSEKSHMEKEVFFIPMDFNTLLEYFNDKGKIRVNTNYIKKTIDKMDYITDYYKKLLYAMKLDKEIINRDITNELKLHEFVNLENIMKNFYNLIEISSKNLTNKDNSQSPRDRYDFYAKSASPNILIEKYILPNLNLERNESEKFLKKSSLDNSLNLDNCMKDMSNFYLSPTNFYKKHHKVENNEKIKNKYRFASIPKNPSSINNSNNNSYITINSNDKTNFTSNKIKLIKGKHERNNSCHSLFTLNDNSKIKNTISYSNVSIFSKPARNKY